MIWNQMMDSIRKWFYKPRKDDKSLLAQFFFSDEALSLVASELDSFDGRQEPERCTNLVQQLRQCQDRVLHIVDAIMNVLIGNERANRDFRVKFPEDVLQDNLSGQLWFGAECLAAGSSIMNRESESTTMRPLAKALVKSLENVRNLLREVCLRSNTPNGPLKLNNNEYITEMLLESLKIFDRLFADFELRYVSAMVNVKTAKEYELQELIGVLFSETLTRALQMDLITQDMIDDCDPAIMFAIPRLAIVHGLLIFPNGPLCIDKSIEEMSEMFKPFRTLLHKIRELLWTLSNKELFFLEKSLCDNHIFDKKTKITDDHSYQELLNMNDNNEKSDVNKIDEFYKDFSMCKDAILQNATNAQQNENASTSSTNSLNSSIRTADQILAPTISVQKFLIKSSRKQLMAHRKSSLKIHLSDDPMVILKADIASRNETKAKFRSSEDLLHRLFVCVSGVADQLQTNFASDLRNILKAVYLINSSKSSNGNESTVKKDNNPLENLEYLPSANDVIISGEYSSDPNLLAQDALFDTNVYLQRLNLSPQSIINNNTENVSTDTSVQLADSPVLVQGQTEDIESILQPPIWIPDMEAPKCMGCDINFTVLKRRHHCRNCGKIFCSKCSAKNMPLPQFGLTKPVRVCNNCFLFGIQE